jgi:hypothetical protein
MCARCGCGEPTNSHGDPQNITMTDVENAARAAGVSTKQAAENICDCCGGHR